MRKIFIIIPLFFILSCEENKKSHLPDIELKAITTNFTNWWQYFNSDIDLSSDFIAYDSSSNKIEKLQFLEELTTGGFVPIKIKTENTTQNTYQLYTTDNSDISATIKAQSETELSYLKRVGKKFPDFNFTDLNGQNITSLNTKGKHIIIKTWFINCTACVKEFPELNELTNLYSNREDIVFISLAYDKEEKLKEFLLKKPLNYNNVKVAQEYIEDTLKFTQYPTHIVIDEKGNINKIFNNANRLRSYLNTKIK
jgi:peroxiredoxin